MLSYNTNQAKEALEAAVKAEAREALEAALNGMGPIDARKIGEHIRFLNSLRRWHAITNASVVNHMNERGRKRMEVPPAKAY